MKRLLTFLIFLVGLTALSVIAIGAKTAEFYKDEERVRVLTADGADQVTLPSGEDAVNRRFVAWVSEGTLYAPGEKVTLTKDTRFDALLVELRTLEGAAVRFTDNMLRFDGAVRLSDYNRLLSLAGAENVTLGMLIVPYISRDPFTLADDREGAMNRTPADFGYETNTEGVFFGETDLLPDSALLEKFAARAYISVTFRGQTVTVYGNFSADDHVRQAHGVTAIAFDDRSSPKTDTHPHLTADGCHSPYTGEELSGLRARLDKVVCVARVDGAGVESCYAPDNFTFEAFHPYHYTSPYVLKEILPAEQEGGKTYITYVVVAKEGADFDRIAAYYIEGSYRAPDRSEWKADGLYIRVQTNITP